jgi:hypothetical protein
MGRSTSVFSTKMIDPRMKRIGTTG